MTRTGWRLEAGEELAPGLTAMRLLGGGNAFEAYLAFDDITYCPVVVKVLRPDRVGERRSLDALGREVEMLATVNHPGVVRMLRSGLEGERPHLVLEHVEGPRLSTLIRRYGPLQPQQYLPLAFDLAAALQYFRHLGLVHLDVKPSNIIMGSPAKLIDLSVARRDDEAAALRTRVGTDGYMAPEQVQPEGPHAVGPASDVWGLGATLYEAVTGERPFPVRGDGEDLADRFPQVTGRLPELSGAVPAPVADLVRQTLAHEPGARPSPAEVVDALEPLMAALPRPKLTFKVKV